MFRFFIKSFLLLTVPGIIFAHLLSLKGEPSVELKRVPGEGIQPQVAVADDGTVHLVYFKRDANGETSFMSTPKDGAKFSEPIE